MIGILIMAHGQLGESLIQCVSYVWGERPPSLRALEIGAQDKQALLVESQRHLAELDDGNGVLLLSDVYGATPANTMCRLLQPGRIEGVAGVNLPMLMRVLTYRHLALDVLVEKAVAGGREGVLYITTELCDATAGH